MAVSVVEALDYLGERLQIFSKMEQAIKLNEGYANRSQSL